MRPLILDVEHSIFDLPGGRLRPGGRDLLQALAAAQVPLALLATAAPKQRAEKEVSLTRLMRREGLGKTEACLASRLVIVDVAAGGEAAVATRHYEDGLRAAASCCGVADHAHRAVLLSYDPVHLEVARTVGLLAYPLGEAAAAAETPQGRGPDTAADLLQALRWHPCDKRREAAKGRFTPASAARKAADPAIAALIAGVSETRSQGHDGRTCGLGNAVDVRTSHRSGHRCDRRPLRRCRLPAGGDPFPALLPAGQRLATERPLRGSDSR